MTTIQIRTARFTLQPLSYDYAEAIFAIRSLPEIYVWTYVFSDLPRLKGP
jgi:hypothetical protein